MSADLGDIMEQVQTAKIAVSAAVYAIDKPYSYRITPAFAEKIRPGMRVTVPFGRGNRHVEGVVLATGWEPEGEKLKSIEALLDQTPVIEPWQLKLALWMRDRFFCTVYDAVKAILPVGVWYSVSCFYRLKKGVSYEQALEQCAEDSIARLAVETVHAHGECSLSDLQIAFCEADPEPVLKKLVSDGILQLTGTEKRRVNDRVTKFARLSQPADQMLAEAQTLRRRAPQQAAILDLLCSVGRAPTREICYFTGASTQSLQALVKKGFLTIEAEPSYRRPVRFDGETIPLPMLTPGRMVTRSPIHTSSPIVTGFSFWNPCCIMGMSSRANSWFLVMMVTSSPIIT